MFSGGIIRNQWDEMSDMIAAIQIIAIKIVVRNDSFIWNEAHKIFHA